MKCFFVSDLHGYQHRYDTLFECIRRDHPDGVFIGGDLLPGGSGMSVDSDEFITTYLFPRIKEVSKKSPTTSFYLIMGNDDPRIFEHHFLTANKDGLLSYVHNAVVSFDELFIVGYSYIPPSPFHLKDWEKYDISRYVDVGASSPESGGRSVDVSADEQRYSTIADDLQQLSTTSPPERTIYLFHSPPYNSLLDRTALDGKMVDHAPVDVHTGSVAIQRFIQEKQPFITLHGHIHESTQLTGEWKQRFGTTYSFSAAHDGPELALVQFDTDNLDTATRVLL